jgi:hypothetical protein
VTPHPVIVVDGRGRFVPAQMFDPPALVIERIGQSPVVAHVDMVSFSSGSTSILLACDGAYRAGHQPEVIVTGLTAKLVLNEASPHGLSKIVR